MCATSQLASAPPVTLNPTCSNGETPVIEVTGRRFPLTMNCAVSPSGYFRFTVHEDSATAPVFRDFLSRLMIGAFNPGFPVADGYPMHKARLVQAFVDGLDGRPALFYLAAFSPHLNPNKQAWTHVKGQVSKQTVPGNDVMKNLALGALRRIQKLPRLVRAFLQQPHCQYAGY